MPSLRFYGGISEIGGNKILVEEAGKSIFLDFGKNFARESEYFDFPFMQAYYIPDLINVGAIPYHKEMEGLYRNTPGIPTPINGVLISHAHADHFGYVSLLNKGTKIYLGKVTKEIVDIRSETYREYWHNVLDHLSFETFTTRNGEREVAKDLEFKAIHVDHSIPAAYGFLIQAGNTTVAYTGDLRLHGHVSRYTWEYIRELERRKGEIDALICEGTYIEREEDPFLRSFENEFLRRMGKRAPIRRKILCETEDDIIEKMGEIVERMEGLVLIETSTADVDRIRTVWKVANETERYFIIDDRQAYIIQELGERTDIRDLPTLRDSLVYLSRRRKKGMKGEFGREDEEEYVEGRDKWQQDLVGMCEKMRRPIIWGPGGRKEIRKRPQRYLVCTSDGAPVLQELAYDKGPFKCNFILSKSEPFSEEMLLSFNVLLHWLALYGIRKYYQIHVSGHCDRDELKQIIEAAEPKKLYPVHTNHPEIFKELYDRVVCDIEMGKAYTL
jgi:ribonuclease J